MIITISGKPGSGKTTVAKILANKLGWEEYYMGALRRKAAADKGMTLQEYNELGEKDPSTDIEVDKYQEELGKTKDNFVIQGRTSFKFIPHSFKVYLDVDLDCGAQRIWEDYNKDPKKRNEGAYKDVSDVKINIQKRIESDKKRYEKYYKIDCYNTKNYDLVIDTTIKNPEEIVQIILEKAKTRDPNL